MKIFLLTFFISFSLFAATDNQIKRLSARFDAGVDRIRRAVRSCAHDKKMCLMSLDELEVFKGFVDLLRKDVTKINLRFKKANGPIFQGESGKHKLAVTGNTPGSDIFINTELALTVNDGKMISIDQTLSLLIHELLHHLGIDDTEDRLIDRVSAKIVNNYRSLAERITLPAPGLEYIYVEIFNIRPLDELYVTQEYDPELMFPYVPVDDISGGTDPANLVNTINQISRQHDSSICSTPKSIKLIKAFNLRWKTIPNSLYEGADVIASCDMNIYCIDSDNRHESLHLVGHISSSLEQKFGRFQLSRSKTSFSVDEIIEDQYFADIKSMSVESYEIINGGHIKGEMLVQLPRGSGKINFCFADLNSKDFNDIVSRVTMTTLSVPLLDCQAYKVDAAKDLWKVVFYYPITKYSRTSTVYIGKFTFETDRFPIVDAIPQRRLEFEIKNDQSIADLQVVGVKLFDHLGNDRTDGYDGFNVNNYICLQVEFNVCPSDLDSYVYEVDFVLTSLNAEKGFFSIPFTKPGKINFGENRDFEKYSYSCQNGHGILNMTIDLKQYDANLMLVNDSIFFEFDKLLFITYDFYFLNYDFPSSFILRK